MADIYDNSSLLMFRVGPVFCCAPSFPVESIIQPPSLTQTPGSNTAHPGLFKHGGNMVSALDLRYQFGVDEADWKHPGRMIIAGVDAGVIGFWVDEIIEVMQMPQTGWGSLPALLPRGVFSRTLLFKEQIYLYAEFEKLFRIPASGFLRPYIEHLIESQQISQKRVASAQAAATSQRHTSLAEQNKTIPKIERPAVADTAVQKNNVHPIKHAAARQATVNNAEPEPSNNNIPANSTVRPVQTRAIQNNTESNKTVISPVSVNKSQISSRTLPDTPINSAVGRITSAETRAPLPDRTEQKHPVSTTGVNESVNRDQISVKPELQHQQRSHTQAKATEQKQFTPQPEHHSSVFPVLLILFILIIAGSAGYWYLTLPGTDKAMTSASPPKSNATVTTEQADYWPEETDTTAKSVPAEPVPAPVASLPEPVTSKAAPPSSSALPAQTTQTTQTEARPAENNNYRANIIKDEQGITIILDSPADGNLFNTNRQDSESAETTTQNTAEEVSVTDTEMTSPPAEQKKINPDNTDSNQQATTTAEKQSVAVETTEIIHIVKKGDTLWHIAIRYVDNPYRYPELARLSNIKNPDLIYPGNRVRIIKRYKRKP